MKTSRFALSIALSLFAGLSLAACGEDSVDADPEGRSCDIPNEWVGCGDNDGEIAYCGFPTEQDAWNWDYAALEYGVCHVPAERECEPGERMFVPDPSGEEDLCGGTSYECMMVENEATWVEEWCDTPLVLRFDDQPVEMLAAESTPMATFDISMRADSCITTDWPAAATPWLVADLDGNGAIDSGHELFGSGTTLGSGRHAEHGFAALSEFDADADGDVDADDPRFAELMLWRDWDADRRSTPDELEPLTSAGVERLAVDFHVDVQCDERGNCGKQRAAFEHAGGVGEVVDLYLSCH